MSVESFKNLSLSFYKSVSGDDFNPFLARRVENEYRKLNAKELLEIHNLASRVDLSKTRLAYMSDPKVEEILGF